MYGEKIEENEELRLDLVDVKEMYKAQVVFFMTLWLYWCHLFMDMFIKFHVNADWSFDENMKKVFGNSQMWRRIWLANFTFVYSQRQCRESPCERKD